jgi:hypothetical protein
MVGLCAMGVGAWAGNFSLFAIIFLFFFYFARI